jgi:hypothetical protein
LRAAFQASQILSRARAKKSDADHDIIWEMKMFTRFSYHFFLAVWRVKTVILTLIALVVAGAVSINLFEKMPFADALYFAFVTGLTIGYGDIVMKTPGGRLIALIIGFVGILFTGLMVAILVFAVRESLEELRNRS